MASIGRLFLLIILVHAACAAPPERPSGDPPRCSKHPEQVKSMARKLMMNCMANGYEAPEKMQNITQQFSGNLTGRGGNGQTLLPDFLSALSSLPAQATDAYRDHKGEAPGLQLDKQFMSNMMWNCSNLPAILKKIKNSPEPHACFMQAFLAPFSWESLMAGKDMNSEDYDSMIWAAKPLLQNTHSSDMILPQAIKPPNMQKMMTLLKEVYGSLSDTQRIQVKNWVRQHVAQNNFNCTLKPKPKPTRAKPAPPGGASDRCPRKMMWLKMKVMKMMGPFVSRLRLTELNAASDDELCEFFNSPNFSSAFQRVGKMNPMLARRFLDRIKKCNKRPQELSENLESLGMLACYYKDDPPKDKTLRSRFLAQLNDCDNSGAQKLKKRLVKKMMASNPQLDGALLSALGSGVSMLSPKQLSSISPVELKKTLKDMGPNVKLRLGQARRLVKKLLRGKTSVDAEDLISMGSAVKGIPPRLLRKLAQSSPGILNDGNLENVTQKFTKAQKMAFMEGLRKSVKASDLIKKLPERLLPTLSLNTLKQANLSSLDQVEGKQWTLPQAAFLLKRLMKKGITPKQIRRLGSVIQGMTCRMMDRVDEKDSLEMADALTESPDLLSKTQVTCAARKLFATLERQRSKYFLGITEQELDDIPTLMLIHLQAGKIRNLPDAVCPTFLTKMTAANLSSMSLRSLSRPALTDRALRCLANGRNMSEISSEEMLDLGQLLCEIPPPQLRRLGPEALNASLQAMATCTDIPRLHRQPLLRLLKENYGNVSDWSQETMESFSPLLLWDETEIKTLRFKPWLEAVLSDLKDSVTQSSTDQTASFTALRKKIFSLKTKPGGSRKKRADDLVIPTVQLIEDLAEDNVFWTPEQLGLMTTETFNETADTLGSTTDYSKEQLIALREKVVEAYGPVGNLNNITVMRLGCVSQSFLITELPDIPLCLEDLEELTDCSWQQDQREAIWKGLSKRCKKTPNMLEADEIVALDQFICGLSPEDIGKLTALREETLSSVGDMQCPLSVTKEFKKHALTLFGAPSNWTEAAVATLGNIVASLDAQELISLEMPVFAYLSKDSIPLIPADVFSALSIEQLKALGPERAAKVTAKQSAALSRTKRDALEEIVTGSRDSNPPSGSGGSGAPSLTIEGIAAYMKPFLFLFLGLLLL